MHQYAPQFSEVVLDNGLYAFVFYLGDKINAGKEWVESGVRGILGDSVVDEMGKEYEKASDLVWSKYGETERLGMDFVTMFTPEGGVVIPAKVVVALNKVSNAGIIFAAMLRVEKMAEGVRSGGKLEKGFKVQQCTLSELKGLKKELRPFEDLKNLDVGTKVLGERGDVLFEVLDKADDRILTSLPENGYAVERSVVSYEKKTRGVAPSKYKCYEDKILSDEKTRKGHGLKYHADSTDEALLRRMAAENLDFVSSFDSKKKYLEYVSKVLCANEIEINDWLKGLKELNVKPGKLELRQEFPETIGRVLEKGMKNPRDGTVGIVILRYCPKDKFGYNVVTGYVSGI